MSGEANTRVRQLARTTYRTVAPVCWMQVSRVFPIARRAAPNYKERKDFRAGFVSKEMTAG